MSSSPPTSVGLLASVCSKKSPECCKRSRTASDWVDSENFKSISIASIGWSHLPPELVEKIAGNLDEIADRVRLGAVCKPWQSASKSILLPRVRLPWLLLGDPDDSWRRLNRNEVQSFFSISDKRIYKLLLPCGTQEKTYHGSPYGWLLTVNSDDPKQRVSLLNPITKAQVLLPPLTAWVSRCKVIATPEALITMVVNRTSLLVYCCRQLKDGDERVKWTKLRVVDQNRKISFACDFTYYEGRYFVLGHVRRQTLIFDPDNSKLLSVISSPAGCVDFCRCSSGSPRDQFLVESSTGEELFLVIRHHRSGHHETSFEVFKLDRTGQQTGWTWYRVTSIGCNILFVDVLRAVVLPATDFDGCRGNCIVFHDYDYARGVYSCLLWSNITRFALFDIENDRVEELPSSWHESVKGWANQGWFVPSL